MGFLSQTTKTRLQTHIIFKTLLFYGNSGYAKAPRCYIIRTLPVLLQTVRVGMLLA